MRSQQNRQIGHSAPFTKQVESPPAAPPEPGVCTTTLSHRSFTVNKFFILAACFLLGACTNIQQTTYQQAFKTGKNPIANSTLEAIHTTPAIPLPLDPSLLAKQFPISADEARLDFGSSISNYRIFSLTLKKGERYSLNVNSLCNNACLGVNKFALKPRAMLLDAYGAVIADKPSHAEAVVGLTRLSWDGEAHEDGTYYLLVAADDDNPGETIAIDDVWINNSPLMAVNVGM
jgi:hypothetical protein